ncbi:MAG: M20/M25/M40 family metallo-hydrolase [Chloroflexi bacterium]|nr:M20/M25/M40 family metallo-hydrolase [Chloroflexota bacterium]MBU1750476.1 M20/M25/M40 family metallo-hydrolase [Chloroflexota bacterium]
MPETVDWNQVRDDAAATLSRYIQFDTTNPPGRELPAAEWLGDQLTRRGITDDVTIYEPAPGRGLLVARIPGTEPLKPLLVNHHIDVVAADPTQWSYPPFSGAIAEGFVWGRGTLDTKNLGIVLMLALELLIKEGVRFRRPIVFLAVPDEETGGSEGMRWLVDQHLADLDPEWVWDEGSGGFTGIFGDRLLFGVAVAEKQIQHLRLVAAGEPGHGSIPHGGNANVTLLNALERILSTPRPLHVHPIVAEMLRVVAQGQSFPRSWLLRHLSNPLVMRLAGRQLAAHRLLSAMLRDTISLTVLRAGYKVNVIPERAEAEIDCRLLPDTPADEFHRWLRERIADERVQLEVTESSPPSGVASLDTAFYRVVTQAIERHAPGAGIFPLLMPGGTDGRYFRQRGYPAYGFGPMILGPDDLARAHGIDERISLDNLELGVQIARDIIRDLCA